MAIQKIDGQTTQNAGTVQPVETIIYDADGDGRVLIGYQKDGFGTGKDFGIKVSQDGHDVREASDDELVMSSAFNSFKIVATGTASISYSGPDVGTYKSTTISHNLGYTPTTVVFVKHPILGGGGDEATTTPFLEYTYSAPYLYTKTMARSITSSTNILFDVMSGFSSAIGTWVFRYYILEETAI